MAVKAMKAALITGAAGGIGAALVHAFEQAGYFVVGTDLNQSISDAHVYIAADLIEIATDDAALNAFRYAVLAALQGRTLNVIVNNAAVQILGSADTITVEAWDTTLRVNLTAPLRLTQAFLPEMNAAHGCVLNIGSVHAQATKKGFVSYATSKAALHGLTRALAVDLGSKVRVACLAPAAVRTPMLHAGFKDNPEALEALESAHPSERIAMPEEVAKAAVALVDEPFLFATGSVFYLDGGILSRLHDPA